jgi:micrococcal nuclease
VRVTDGDTIVVNIDGKEFRLRYIGIDSPESGESGGYEATQKNKALVEGKTVTLVKDVSETDSYGRLLRYVFVEEIFVNYEMVRSGYAESGSWPPDTSCDEIFSSANNIAKTNRLGLWNSTATPIYFAPIYPTSQPGATSQPIGGCNCSVDYNCDDFSTHSEAQACYVSCGGNNWAGLDRDNDGSACESLP